MSLLNFIPKSVLFFLSTLVISSFLYSCGIYKPVDARKISPNSKERVKKNLEEGRGMSLKKMMGGEGGTNYQFASSNPMWRATLEILDFLPLAKELLNFFFSKTKARGATAKKPTKNLTALKVNGPISSIPVSWAINVVPQMKVQRSALNNEIVFDIKFFIWLAYKQNFYLSFL